MKIKIDMSKIKSDDFIKRGFRREPFGYLKIIENEYSEGLEDMLIINNDGSLKITIISDDNHFIRDIPDSVLLEIYKLFSDFIILKNDTI